ncbi:MAG TPA: hypothetical protein VMS21_07815 [Methylomirabilota bacterium]|nr:hypothetical protein [Methylomirabilota bacterium]
MRFAPTHRPDSGSSPARSRRALQAFTLAEVLAALVFMAIVIPVAVEGVRIASLAGVVGERKTTATRVAERVLNEHIITGAFRSGGSGLIREGIHEFQYSIRTEPWSEDTMQLVTVQVIFPVRGRDYDVRLSTLLDNTL